MARSPRTPRRTPPYGRRSSYGGPSPQTLASLARTGYRAYQAFSGRRTSTSSRGSSTGTRAATVTQQHDIKSLYRRKRMPKRKKRKWVKFVQKVKAVEASGRGNQSVVINDTYIDSWPNTLQTGGYRWQGISEVNLYSVNADVKGGRDKDYILNEITNWQTRKEATTGIEAIADQATLLANELKRIKVPMNHARIDITYTNTSQVTLEIDLYVIKHKVKQARNATGYTSLIEAQDQYNIQLTNGDQKLYYSDGSVINSGAGTLTSLRSRGVTPFNTPGLNLNAGATVLNKTKVLIAPGSSVTRQYSENKHKFIYPHLSEYKTRYDKDTITYLAIAKATGLGNPEESGLNSFTTSWTKTYSWTQEGQKQTRQTYFPENN